MNPNIKNIYQKIAKKHDLSFEQVKEIVDMQFLFVKEVMAEGKPNNPDSYKTIQLTHIGKFAIREHKLKEYKNKANEKGKM
jgi:nucleoid DNA-binding protein